MNTIEGHTVSLECDVQTHLTSEIIWTKDGQLLKFGSGVQILSGNIQEDHHHLYVIYIYGIWPLFRTTYRSAVKVSVTEYIYTSSP